MSESILESVKRSLGIVPEFEAFDPQLIMYCNTAFATLSQLGIGPEGGFSISDETAEWADYLGDKELKFEIAKTYMYMRVRLMFDPPSSSFALESMKEQIKEFEWRLIAENELRD